MQKVTIVGGGMAGSEAALQLARRGIPVRLVEMRPVRPTEAHHTDGFAELVCSNSFRGDGLANAVGLLKEEMRRAGGALVRIAGETAVPAGGALAVDRDRFSDAVTEAIENEELIEIVREEFSSLPDNDDITIIATGPLTSSSLADALIEVTGEDRLYFYDSIAPIIDADSIDRDIVFAQSRYDKSGTPDYLNCPMTEEEYVAFIEAVKAADLVVARDFEDANFFEACLPIEITANRGLDTLRFGPMKPVGLTDPRTGKEPWAVVQLRMENLEGSAYNMVGFQSRMKWGQQKEIFRTIPGLENAEFMRFGSIHRNTFLHGPEVLDENMALKTRPNIYLGGQITGSEGYVEAQALGMVLGQVIAAKIHGTPIPMPPAETALGGLVRHVTGQLAYDPSKYQPSNITWGMVPTIPRRKIRKKVLRRLAASEIALDALDSWLSQQESHGLRLEGFSSRSIEDARAQIR